MADAKEPTGEELRAIAYRFTGSSDDIEQFRNCYRAGIAADKASREQQRGLGGPVRPMRIVTSDADVDRLALVGQVAWRAAFMAPETMRHGNAYQWQCAIRAVLAELAKGTVGR